jgi:hypothetical protein
MSQKLFELIKNITGHECQEDELDKIIKAVKEMDAPDEWLCPIAPKDIPYGYKWVAMDKNGAWWAYGAKPKKGVIGFYTEGLFIASHIAVTRDTHIEWGTTLQKIPR